MMRHGMQSVISNCVDGGGETDLVQDLSRRYSLEIKMACFQYPGGGTAEMLLDPLTCNILFSLFQAECVILLTMRSPPGSNPYLRVRRSLTRNRIGQLSSHVQYEGIIT